MTSALRSWLLVPAVCLLGAACTVDALEEAPDLGERTASTITTCIGPDALPSPSISQPEVFEILGLVQFYSHPSNFGLLYTGPWTNWYLDGTKHALAKLATMRGFLDATALHDTYLPGDLAGHAGPEVTCDDVPDDVRAIDGRCNDPSNPLMGAAGVRFGRNVPLPYGHADQNLLEPNPRTISRKLLRRKQTQTIPFLNMLAAAWVQFQVHDWFSHGENHPTDVIEVPLAEDDELAEKYGIASLRVPITTPDPSRRADEAGLPPTFLNEVTHWWDGSQIYGSDQATADRLRSFEGGKLRVGDDGLLPAGEGGFADTGFRRNWWIGLSLLHTLFVHEHNAIADALAAAYPEWSDQQLYDKARMINAALIAKIHTLEWTPAILPNPTLYLGMNANWGGLNQFIEPPFPPPAYLPEPYYSMLQPAFPILYGVVGGDLDRKGVPFSLTEEFVSVYRMHPLLPEKIEVRSFEAPGHDNVPTEMVRDYGARALTQQYGVDQLMYSFGVTHPGTLTLENYPKFLQDLALPMGVMDLGTVDIVRDRERGVPRYNQFRRLLGLRPIASFDELTDDANLVNELEKVYGGDVEKLDLMVGTYAEGYRPTCYGFGETAFQVFTLMATRRLQADRFYTTSFNADVYTPEGMSWIADNDMKSVLLRHYPALAETGLADVSNAFMPWE